MVVRAYRAKSRREAVSVCHSPAVGVVPCRHLLAHVSREASNKPALCAPLALWRSMNRCRRARFAAVSLPHLDIERVIGCAPMFPFWCGYPRLSSGTNATEASRLERSSHPLNWSPSDWLWLLPDRLLFSAVLSGQNWIQRNDEDSGFSNIGWLSGIPF
jgi:hypothetical protein